MMDIPVPITHYPWGGSNRPVAFAEGNRTADAVTFRLWCFEAHPLITCTEPNSMVCLDSCLEVFLNPFPAFSDDYLNFEMNAAGTLLLQKGPDRAHRRFVSLALEGYPQVKAFRMPEMWGVELHVPFSFLRAVYGPDAPQCPQNPIGNFYQCSGPPAERYGCWKAPNAPQPDFHRPESFASIPFLQNP